MSSTNKGLDRTTLKLIAICAMVIDHIAWAFVPLASPLGQILHILGRMTIPIMCFFVAEGFRKTSNVANYIGRMSVFAVASIIPFWLFFHEEYVYRQNFIFDLLLGLLVLTALESSLAKWAKLTLPLGLAVISVLLGGWPLLPILLILIFYYGKSFRQQAALTAGSVLVTMGVAAGLSAFNATRQLTFLGGLTGEWWQYLYLLGFIAALPLLKLYNGNKGRNVGGRYFFYIFYPVHLMVLAGLKYLIHDFAFYDFYLGCHVIALMMCFMIAVLALKSRPGKGQNAIILFMFSAMIYVMGFILEIVSTTVDGFYAAIIIEYFGEVIVMVGLTYYTQTLFGIKVPAPVYVAQVVTGMFIMGMIFTTRENGFFYREIAVDTTGMLPKPELTYGPGFYLSILYIVGVTAFLLVNCIRFVDPKNGVAAKRAQLTIASVACMWLPYLIKTTGLTHDYEFPAFGIMAAAVTFYLVLTKYNFLDSLTLASDNVLDHGQEGIMVLGEDFELQFQNTPSKEIFGELPYYRDVRESRQIEKILAGEKKTLNKNDRIYEFRIEELREKNVNHGFMIWSYDATERIRAMHDMEQLATRDNLTGIYNRVHFAKLVDAYFATGGTGCFFMVDMDNFKKVNDQLGHQVGDAVLKCFGRVMKGYRDERLISARIGGDEFMGFYKDSAERIEAVSLMVDIMKEFDAELENIGQGGCTSLSIGTVLCGEKTLVKRDFATIYAIADEALYTAKEAGKNRYYITKA